MGRIFISAGHGGFEGRTRDPGSVVGNTTEAQEMILIRDLVAPELRSRGFEVLSVPDDLSSMQTLDWINARARTGDVALEIQANAFSNPATRGTSVYYISNNDQRKAHAELLLLALLRRVPQLQSRGAKADTTAALGSLVFCRQVVPPSLLMEIGFLSNPDDRAIIQTRRRDVALGIADGLASWSRAVSGISPTPTPTPTPPAYSTVDININGGIYDEKGIIVNGNAYIPIDLADQLGVNLARSPEIRRISYRNVVYIKAIELRAFNISVSWESSTRTIVLRSVSVICPGLIDRIMGHGNTSEVQLMMFLKSNNEDALVRFPDLPKLYREESAIEGVNHDIAFCQMCVETAFLRFGTSISPEQNNFGGIAAVGGDEDGATFPSARIGVRAQIQHLKAYASTAPLVQELVDPRFRFVTRGVAPLIDQLSGRWAADLQYGTKVMAILRRLYESAGLL
ncbi:N-acetylmuramoyl-L-alanine amidase [Oscillatoria sp. FACHB-1407]|uniref:hormogonium tapered terminus morphoprotein TftA n=1 Tax=Oscillatoria sp. FACHB-1407 TaxID=2692847 RepID=UPI00168960D5|nr:N-acetylmuramoyl-L-alanine amidase [Oscillatoria sp. FACHB-1407]MBD2464560.1 N-acetylmuramoyl-L-alanine amidase [Oscillatoria sp. FACHB-1407]